VEPLVVESFAWIEPELAFEFDTPEFSLQEPVVSFAAPSPSASENHIENYLADLAETMRQRQMLDLDQSGPKANNTTFTDLIWTDDDLFDDSWLDFSEPAEADFWSEAFENDLLLLKTGI